MITDPDLVKADYEIHVDGQPIDEVLMRSCSEVRVVDYLALPDLCTFNISFDTGRPGDDPISKHPFEIGAEIKIKLAPRNSKVVKDVFVGEVLTLEPKFSSGGAELTVRAFDRSHRLNRGRKARVFQQATASDIVKKVLTEAGLRAEVDSTKGVFKFMQQSNETDLDFIWRLAHRVGFEFSVMDKTGKFKKAGTSRPIELEWPTQVQTFSPRLTAVQQVDEVEVRSWDPKTKRAFIKNAGTPRQSAKIGIERSKVKSPFGKSKFTVVTEPTQSMAENAELAQALLDRTANAYVTAEGTCDGNPAIRAGALVKITGIGAKFGGTYRVQSSNHLLTGGSTYVTEFASTAIQTITGAIAASKPPDFGSHLVVGIVTNNKDPDKMNRVRVQYPALSDDGAVEGWWARVLVPNAGKDRGVSMLPAVGDEVLIGFEHDDPTHPYVMGSLYNGKDVPGDELSSPDGHFAIKSDHKMVMRSKEDMIVSSDKELQMTIQGKATLNFKADLAQEVGTNMNLKVGSNFELKGSINVTLDAGAQLQIKGSTIAIQSSGPLTLKGNPIDINGPMVNIGGGMVNLG